MACDIGEAAHFATYFTGSLAAESTPHLYILALATWSQDTSLCQNWKEQFSCIPVFTHTKGNIDVLLMTVLAESPIMAVAFSSNGMQIASGSLDGFVQVWHVSTGAEVKVLKSHTSSADSCFQVMACRLCLAQVTILCGYGMYQQER